MRKDDFHKQLRYGKCEGSDVIRDMKVVPAGECFWGNSGEKSEICPLSADQQKCNCCERCRKNCTRKRYILDRNRAESQAELDQVLQELREEQEKIRVYNEARDFVKHHFGL